MIFEAHFKKHYVQAAYGIDKSFLSFAWVDRIYSFQGSEQAVLFVYVQDVYGNNIKANKTPYSFWQRSKADKITVSPGDKKAIISHTRDGDSVYFWEYINLDFNNAELNLSKAKSMNKGKIIFKTEGARYTFTYSAIGINRLEINNGRKTIVDTNMISDPLTAFVKEHASRLFSAGKVSPHGLIPRSLI